MTRLGQGRPEYIGQRAADPPVLNWLGCSASKIAIVADKLIGRDSQDGAITDDWCGNRSVNIGQIIIRPNVQSSAILVNPRRTNVEWNEQVKRKITILFTAQTDTSMS